MNELVQLHADIDARVRAVRDAHPDWLGEIEARLAEHPAVRETAVLAREDGSGGKRLVAYYTGDAELTVDNLRDACGQALSQARLR